MIHLLYSEEIQLHDLLDPEFYFKERGKYTIRIKNTFKADN